jgi:hypothetical protein
MFSEIEFLCLTIGSLLVTPVFNLVNFTNGQAGLDYYGEVHLSSWNSWVHTIGMPFTFYGISCWFPALFGLSNKGMNRMQKYVWYLLFMHYIYIDILRGLFCALFYIVPMINAHDTVEFSKSRWDLIKHGLIYSVVALVCQEYFGHYLGGDDPSRPEAVPNAIVYATYYSTYHLW